VVVHPDKSIAATLKWHEWDYSLVEAEAILACQAVGLDPGLGIVHANAKGRQSLALDLMEPVRSEVDAFVLHVVEHRTFRKAEFTETSDGHVELLAPLTHELAETMPTWAKSLGPIAEHVAHVFGKAMAGTYLASTPITRRRTRAAQAVVKARKASAQSAATSSTPRQKPMSTNALSLWSCPDCGGAVTNPRHVRCEACISAVRCSGTRDQGTARSSHRGTQRGALGMEQGQSRCGVRPGAVPEGDPAEARNCTACRDHGGGRLFQGVRQRHYSGEVDTTRVDVEGAGGTGRRVSSGICWIKMEGIEAGA
jgi:hypothetical protein